MRLGVRYVFTQSRPGLNSWWNSIPLTEQGLVWEKKLAAHRLQSAAPGSPHVDTITGPHNRVNDILHM
jgi:hypothetical protein